MIADYGIDFGHAQAKSQRVEKNRPPEVKGFALADIPHQGGQIGAAFRIVGNNYNTIRSHNIKAGYAIRRARD